LMDGPLARFIGFGLIAFIVAGVVNVPVAFSQVSKVTDFTWFAPAQTQLRSYGFFAMTMFGAIYYILPRLTALEFPSPRLVRIHFWVAAIGIVFIVLPLAI